MRYWDIPREWADRTCFLILGGPSVADQDLELLRGRHVVAVNSSFARVPWAEYLFFGDSRWWTHNRQAVLAGFPGRIVTSSSAVVHDRVLHVGRVSGPPPAIAADRNKVVLGRTSTLAAINLAVHLGVNRIVLLGLDMGAAKDGRTHHHEPHPWPQTKTCWAEQIKDLGKLVAPLRDRGIEVINTSPVSPVDWWRKATLEECLGMSALGPDWRGKRVALIGGGPSLRGFDLSRLRGRAIVVAINDAIRAAPWADVAFSIDTVWLQRRQRELEAFTGEIVAAVPAGWRGAPLRARLLRRVATPGLSRDPGALCTGENSGFAALGMALMRDAAMIALLGYDMTDSGHFHNGYEWRSRYGPGDYQRWASFFDILATEAKRRGCDVINCNPDSAVRCFRFGSVEEMLA